jgi:hypothetical protein
MIPLNRTMSVNVALLCAYVAVVGYMSWSMSRSIPIAAAITLGLASIPAYLVFAAGGVVATEYRKSRGPEICSGSPGCWDCYHGPTRSYRGYAGFRIDIERTEPDAVSRLRTMLSLLGAEHRGSWAFGAAPFDFFALGVRLDDNRPKTALGFENFDILRILSEGAQAQAKACGVIASPLSELEIFMVDDLLRDGRRSRASVKRFIELRSGV